MKNVTPELLALMQSSQQFILADLYTITLASGAVLRYTDFDIDISFGNNMLLFSETFEVATWVKPFATAKDNQIVSPSGIKTAAAFTFNGQSWLTARQAVEFPADRYSPSMFVYVPSGQGVTSWQAGWDFSDAESAWAPVSTVLDAWVRISAPVTLAAPRSFLDFNLKFNNAAPANGKTCYLFGAQTNKGTAPENYSKTESSPVAGSVFSAMGPIFTRGKTRVVIGLEVDTLDLEISPRVGQVISGLPFAAAAVSGVFDGANLMLERAYISSSGSVIGALVMFSGRFADVEVSMGKIGVRVNSDVAMLQIQIPRSIYQPSCPNTLYTGTCGVDRSVYAKEGTVSGPSTASRVACSLNDAAEYYDLGYVAINSGPLAGERRTVKSSAPGVFTVFNPFSSSPGIGVTFTIYPGCDKSLATCQTKFSNRPSFRGYPFIPVPETTL